MTIAEAREIRAALSECLDPLYAARLGNIPRHIAIERAVGRLQQLDLAILETIKRKEARDGLAVA